MSFTALILIVCSAGLHASWNLVAKKNRMSLPFYAIICATAALFWLGGRYGFRLAGKRIGVIGAGRVGERVCRQMRALGLEIIRVLDGDVRKDADRVAMYIEDQCKLIQERMGEE